METHMKLIWTIAGQISEITRGSVDSTKVSDTGRLVMVSSDRIADSGGHTIRAADSMRTVKKRV